MERFSFGKLLEAAKYCGVLKLLEDPMVYQKYVRDAWPIWNAETVSYIYNV